MLLEKLPCKLDDDEVRRKGEELARTERKYGEVEEEKKAVTKELGDKLKRLRAEMDRFAEEVHSKTEYREVEVIERKDMDNAMVETIRVDTGEIVRSRAMTLNERQVHLFPMGARYDDETGKESVEEEQETQAG